ncbi:MAG: PAS domain S-box protein [Gammaproteobacteria bacterium]|nr:PAS domain S-box protein [Gammaproteobacteria bacterium]
MIDWIKSQFLIPNESILIYGFFDNNLVLLSLLVAIFSSFMALHIGGQSLSSASASRRHTTNLIGSLALGGGIWSMHFIGMLAFDLCTVVEYNMPLTFASLIPSIAASYVALTYLQTHTTGLRPLLLGGVLVGSGIGAMHYTGMASMEMAPLLRYDLSLFALSIVVAVSLSMLSLWIRVGLQRFERLNHWQVNLLASIVMGFAIAGMHYTGMAAARFVRPPGMELSEQTGQISFYLAIIVSIITIVFTTIVLGVNILFKYKDISKQASSYARRLQAMTETAVDCIISINANGVIESVNRSTEKLLGWSPQELVGNNISMLMPEPYKSQHDSYIHKYLTTGEANIIGSSREVKAKHKHGHLIDVRLAIGHVNLEQENFFVGYISDLTQRIEMEQAIRENEAKFRSLIGNIPGIAYRCLNEKDWPMIFISDAVEAMTGYPASDFLLPNNIRSFTDLYHPEDRKPILSTPTSNKNFRLEYRILTKNNDVRWVLEIGNYVQDEESGVAWLDGFIMDITERREMEQQLIDAKEIAEEAAEARSAFMANMSHEIRTPMNSIIGFSDILLDADLNTEQKRHVATINSASKSLLHLLNDILDSAKLDKGKLELETIEFSLIEEVDSVVSTLWLQARSKGLALNVNVPNKLEGYYLGSPDRIRQVLTNIIGNAIKFTESGEVTVTLTPGDDNMVRFEISDTGIGMTPEQVESVFDPFKQADASMSRKFGGTGLGTTISKQLVELMGGKIHVSSTFNQGTVFWFDLPLKQISQSNKPSQPIKNVSLPSLNVLVVDDIQQNVDLLTLLLERDGHKVTTANNGQQALDEMAKLPQFDLVLMDIQMPVLDGLTATTQRRVYERSHQLSQLPIIALTASVLLDDKVAAEQAGMQGFANKPVDYDALRQEIARVLGIDVEVSNEQEEPSYSNKNKLFDEQKGVNLWGDIDAYYQQISNFIDAQSEEIEHLQQLIKASKPQEATAKVHALKGVSGNLALTKLQKLFETIESEIAESSFEQALTTLGTTQKIFTQISDKVKVWQSNEEPAETDNSIDRTALIQLLNNLSLQAMDNEIDESMLDQLKIFKTKQISAEIKLIYDAFNDFEFEAAAQHIKELLQLISDN